MNRTEVEQLVKELVAHETRGLKEENATLRAELSTTRTDLVRIDNELKALRGHFDDSTAEMRHVSSVIKTKIRTETWTFSAVPEETMQVVLGFMSKTPMNVGVMALRGVCKKLNGAVQDWSLSYLGCDALMVLCPSNEPQLMMYEEGVEGAVSGEDDYRAVDPSFHLSNQQLAVPGDAPWKPSDRRATAFVHIWGVAFARSSLELALEEATETAAAAAAAIVDDQDNAEEGNDDNGNDSDDQSTQRNNKKKATTTPTTTLLGEDVWIRAGRQMRRFIGGLSQAAGVGFKLPKDLVDSAWREELGFYIKAAEVIATTTTTTATATTSTTAAADDATTASSSSPLARAGSSGLKAISELLSEAKVGKSGPQQLLTVTINGRAFSEVDLLAEITNRDEGDAAAWSMLGHALESQQQQQQQQQQGSTIAAYNPGATTSSKDAAMCFLKALKLDPEHAQAWYGIARCSLAAKQRGLHVGPIHFDDGESHSTVDCLVKALTFFRTEGGESTAPPAVWYDLGSMLGPHDSVCWVDGQKISQSECYKEGLKRDRTIFNNNSFFK